ncbi:hypothetical protein RJ641_033605 [Dillenia turbinata]|uniref:Uncharacterized protein n=1 Tax=Dillenia turbinata TaxID=194707 RepID=A0AAN8VM55_9MAGN
MMNHVTSTIYSPSKLAAAVHAARCTLGKSPAWNETLMLPTEIVQNNWLAFIVQHPQASWMCQCTFLREKTAACNSQEQILRSQLRPTRSDKRAIDNGAFAKSTSSYASRPQSISQDKHLHFEVPRHLDQINCHAIKD